jgi:hypothetical protein
VEEVDENRGGVVLGGEEEGKGLLSEGGGARMKRQQFHG